MELLEDGYVKFKCKVANERYYNSDSNWGCFVFHTNEEIPHFEIITIDDPFNADNGKTVKLSNLAGNMQQLYSGSEYEVIAKPEYNSKYKWWQYNPKSIISCRPKTVEQQKEFLKSILTESQAKTLLKEYPNIVDDIINGNDNVDFSKTKGIKEKTYVKIKDTILQNYVISDILTFLQPLGITYKTIRRLIKTETNPVLLKERIIENPYRLLLSMKGFGWIKTDNIALKINPELKNSSVRVYAFIRHYLNQQGEDNGHTWIETSELRKAIVDNINESLSEFEQIINNEKKNEVLLHFTKDGNKVGLLKWYQYEKSIYETLNNLNTYSPLQISEEDILKGIDKANKEQGFELNEDQISVIRESLKSNVFLLTGKAGTSKTTTSRAILNIYKQAGYSISCCAFSAKAAQRITEATGFEAQTIHRLYKYNPQFEKFMINENEPLESDVIFVDEASMINVEIFYHVVKGIEPGKKIIICGDDGQLPPIGQGNIFSDTLKKKDNYLISKLTKVLRQAEDSGILHDANMIRVGKMPIEKPTLKQVTGVLKDMTYMFREDPEILRNIAISSYMAAIKQIGVDNVTIITPRKDNCCNSTSEINNIINEMYISDIDKKKKISYGNKNYYIGSKIIQNVNNYEKNVFNGETGYVRDITEYMDKETNKKETMLVVEFIMNDNSKIVNYKKEDIKQLDLAYALTVHKMQGSSSHTIIVIIDSSHYTMLDSCILYTALTRAKKRCLLLSQPNAFVRCIRNNKNKKRQTWLEIFR